MDTIEILVLVGVWSNFILQMRWYIESSDKH